MNNFSVSSQFASKCTSWPLLLTASPTQPKAPVVAQAKALLSRSEAAAYLGVSAQTLASWACNKRVDIPFVKIGRRVQYRRIDLEAFCATNRKGLPTETAVQQ